MKQSWWRKPFQSLAALVRRSRPDQIAMSDDQPPMDAEMLQGLVDMIFSTRSDELSCDECFEHVGRFAELELEGKDAAAALPLVKDHLDRCRCCQEEFDALLKALEAIA
jgi:hypothetical protein